MALCFFSSLSYLYPQATDPTEKDLVWLRQSSMPEVFYSRKYKKQKRNRISPVFFHPTRDE